MWGMCGPYAKAGGNERVSEMTMSHTVWRVLQGLFSSRDLWNLAQCQRTGFLPRDEHRPVAFHIQADHRQARVGKKSGGIWHSWASYR